MEPKITKENNSSNWKTCAIHQLLDVIKKNIKMVFEKKIKRDCKVFAGKYKSKTVKYWQTVLFIDEYYVTQTEKSHRENDDIWKNIPTKVLSIK